MFYIITILLWFGAVRCELMPSESVIVTAARAQTTQLVLRNKALLDLLPSVERRGVSALDTLAVLDALRTTRNFTKPEFGPLVQAAIAGVEARFGVQEIRCAIILGPAVVPLVFLGAFILMAPRATADTSCTKTFTTPPQAFLDTLSAFLRVHETVQTTSDRILRVEARLVDFSTDDGSADIIRPGRAAFLPMLSAPQDHPSFYTLANMGLALYDDRGTVEAPVTFIGTIEACAGEVSDPTRFNPDPDTAEWRLAYSAESGEGVPGLCSADLLAGLGVASNSLVGGVVFLDANRNGARDPWERTVDIGIDLITVAIFDTASSVLKTATEVDSLGRYAVTFDMGDTRTLAVALESVNLDNPVIDGFVLAPSVCGAANPRMRATVVPTVTFLRYSYLLTTQAKTSDDLGTPALKASILAWIPLLVAPSDVTPLRQATFNFGVHCEKDGILGEAPRLITVEPLCSDAQLTLGQSTIVDTFRVTMRRQQALAQFQSWFGAAALGDDIDTVLVDATYFALPTDATSNFIAALGIAPASAATVEAEQKGLLETLEIRTTLEATSAGLPTDIVMFDIVLTTQYALPDISACPVLPGAGVTLELVLNAYSSPLDPSFMIGSVGARCVHAQAPECVNGEAPPPIQQATGRGPNGTAAVVLALLAIAIAIFCCGVACSSVNGSANNGNRRAQLY